MSALRGVQQLERYLMGTTSMYLTTRSKSTDAILIIRVSREECEGGLIGMVVETSRVS